MNLSYTKVFPSDLKVVFRRMKSPLVTLNLWARVGVKDEEPVQIGISHFFEHMVFKGTTNYPGLELSRQVQAIGGNINAGTSLDTTDFYIVVPNNHWEKSLELIIDLVNNPLLIRLISNVRKSNHSGDTFRRRRSGRKLDTTLYHEVFSGTPYERSILGSKDTIAHLKRENFIYHQEYFYHPSNLTLVVCGDLPENQLFEKIDQFTKMGKTTAEFV